MWLLRQYGELLSLGICVVTPASAVHRAGSNAPAWVCLSAAFWEQDVLLTPLIPLYITQSGNKNQIQTQSPSIITNLEDRP